MPAGQANNFARLDNPGPRQARQRDPATVFSHLMPGASDQALLSGAVTLRSDDRWDSHQVFVEVTLTNEKAGHHVPTDSPLRQMLLVVTATDTNHTPLRQLDGPRLPNLAGLGNTAKGCYASLPGKALADQKGCDTPDILMTQLQTILTPPTAELVGK
jgi:hypothetical protein